jgi:hypothetical protein
VHLCQVRYATSLSRYSWLFSSCILIPERSGGPPCIVMNSDLILNLKHTAKMAMRKLYQTLRFCYWFFFCRSSTHAELLTRQDQKSPYPIFSAHEHSDFKIYRQDVDEIMTTCEGRVGDWCLPPLPIMLVRSVYRQRLPSDEHCLTKLIAGPCPCACLLVRACFHTSSSRHVARPWDVNRG